MIRNCVVAGALATMDIARAGLKVIHPYELAASVSKNGEV